MTAITRRLERLEARTVPDERQIISIGYVIMPGGTPGPGRVVSLPDGAPTADALAARARLEADGYTVRDGYGVGP